MSDFDCRNTDEIVCPHCGYIHSDSWDFFGNTNTIEVECSECEKSFECEREFETHYTTWIPKL